MQQQRHSLDVAARKRQDLAQARAMELEAKHPQLAVYDNEVEDRSPAVRGGGDAGLARVVGGRRGRKPKNVMLGASNGHMEGSGHSPESDSDEEMKGGAAHQGKMLGRHLVELHGKGFFDDFAKGFMSVVKPLAGVASFLPGPLGMAGKVASGLLGQGKRRGRPRKHQAEMEEEMEGGAYQVAHAPVETNVGLPGGARGGQDVLPGGVAPRAYGNVPQAPRGFERNTVGMGQTHYSRATAEPRGAGVISSLGIPLISNLAGMFGLGKEKKAKRPASARNQAIAKLMREKGMKLGEASAYLKKHGSA